MNERTPSYYDSIPALPLRGISIFPGMMLTFDVEREVSVTALNAALAADQVIMLIAQKDITKDSPISDDLYEIGTICMLKQMLRIPGATAARVMVEGLSRGRVLSYRSEAPCFYVEAVEVPDAPLGRRRDRTEALIRHCCGMFEEYIRLSGNGTQDMLLNIIASEDPVEVFDYITNNIFLKHTQKQTLLEETRPERRLSLLNDYLGHEVNILTIEQDIQENTRELMGQTQKDFFLREQMKVIQAELGEGEDTYEEISEYRSKIAALGLEKEIEEKLLKEVSRIAKQPFGSSEGAVLRSYLDTCLELPWNVYSREMIDLDKARKQLDADHFGLEKVKERVLEYLAVRKLAPDVKGGILCLIGPPGTGKTSVAISIAKATNRKLARISLGGVHDEAEIRGHRKTYVGAMPGRIINGFIQAKTHNPLMLLDEIDKMGSDYRGDPSSALLEALDFEQNSTFRDHYLEVPFDLSDVFFITTANTTGTIPPALLDRMEVIELSSYTDEEKLQIAKRHLLPKQRKKHGLTGAQLKISDNAIRDIIVLYTRESGVRILERQLAAVCRKCSKAIACGEVKGMNVKPDSLEMLLGAPKYKPDVSGHMDEVGIVRGLAWTSVGGEMLEVEAGVMDGSGKLELTGNLGDVMKESASAAISYIRTRAAYLGIDPEFYKNKDIHLHFPEGAVPKDGPSAGIAICIAVISALTGRPVRRDFAMTGEITLRGRILPIGGLKEKTMAALRNGVHNIIIPAQNEHDLEEIDQTVRSALNFTTADHVDKIIDIALVRSIQDAKAPDRAEPGVPPIPGEGLEKLPATIRQ